MLRRLVGMLPERPPDAYIGFWSIFGGLLLFGLLVEGFPTRLVDHIVFWGRLIVGLGCLAVAAGLGWRRTHPS